MTENACLSSAAVETLGRLFKVIPPVQGMPQANLACPMEDVDVVYEIRLWLRGELERVGTPPSPAQKTA